MEVRVKDAVVFEFSNDHLGHSTVYPREWHVPFEQIEDFVHDLKSVISNYDVQLEKE